MINPYYLFGTAVRIILTGVILVVVWNHAHWSVALAITGLTLNGEAVSYLIGRRVK